MVSPGEPRDDGGRDPSAGSAQPRPDRPDEVPPQRPRDTLVTVVPNSGIQFLDLVIPPSAHVALMRRFIEEPDPALAGSRILYNVAIEDEAVLHPLTRLPVATETMRRISGRDALEAFREAWMPLPFLRVLRSAKEGDATRDEGPTNWVRGYLTPQPDESYLLTVAIDTCVDMTAREPGAPYPAPCVDDVHFESSFVLDHECDQLADVVSERWMGEWITGHLARAARDRTIPGVDDAEFTLAPVAYYMTFLAVVAEIVPRLRFAGAASRDRRMPAVPVDLVIDVGASRTCAVLVEGSGEASVADLTSSTMLELRDLGRPASRHAGPFSSQTEFARAAFGSEAVSRLSGRANAFLWPSLVRVGPEAQRLASAAHAMDGPSGLDSPKRHVEETAPTSQVWRFARVGTAPGRMVTGPMLALISESGDLLARSPGSREPAVRPRFSPSSVMSFFVAEVLLQALSHVSSLAHRETRPRPDMARRLRRIVMTAPVTMPPDAREILRQRVESAIDLVWQSYGWSGTGADAADSPDGHLIPLRPEIRLGFDESMATQVTYLYDVIAHRWRGSPADYFNLMGKARAEHGPHPTLRVASLDIGAGSTALTIVTYAATNEGAVTPALTLAESCPIGGERLIEAVVARFLMPAVERALERSGLAEARAFLADILGPSPGPAAGAGRDQEGFRQRLGRRVALPIAQSIMSTYEALGPDTDTDQYAVRIGDLTLAPDDINRSAIETFEDLAQEAGAVGFRLAEVEIALIRSDISAAVCAVLRPLITTVSPVIRSFDCDLMLLSGWTARLADVLELLVDNLPLRPDRILPIHGHRVGDWYPFRAPSRRIEDPKPVVVVGALLGSLGVSPMSPALDQVRRLNDTHYLGDLARVPPTDHRWASIDLTQDKARLSLTHRPGDHAKPAEAGGPETPALAEAP